MRTCAWAALAAALALSGGALAQDAGTSVDDEGTADLAKPIAPPGPIAPDAAFEADGSRLDPAGRPSSLDIGWPLTEEAERPLLGAERGWHLTWFHPELPGDDGPGDGGVRRLDLVDDRSQRLRIDLVDEGTVVEVDRDEAERAARLDVGAIDRGGADFRRNPLQQDRDDFASDPWYMGVYDQREAGRPVDARMLLQRRWEWDPGGRRWVASYGPRPEPTPVDARARLAKAEPRFPPDLKGELLGFRPVRLVGHPRAHVLAVVATSLGDVALVDLGPRSGLEPLGLRRGVTLEAWGRPGSLDATPLFLAERVEARGREVRVTRMPGYPEGGFPWGTRLRSASAPGPLPGGGLAVRGRIDEMWRVETGPDEEPRLLARLILDDGSQVLTSFAGADQPERMGLRPGRTVLVNGPLMNVDGRALLLARQVRPVAPGS